MESSFSSAMPSSYLNVYENVFDSELGRMLFEQQVLLPLFTRIKHKECRDFMDLKQLLLFIYDSFKLQKKNYLDEFFRANDVYDLIFSQQNSTTTPPVIVFKNKSLSSYAKRPRIASKNITMNLNPMPTSSNDNLNNLDISVKIEKSEINDSMTDYSNEASASTNEIDDSNSAEEIDKLVMNCVGAFQMEPKNFLSVIAEAYYSNFDLFENAKARHPEVLKRRVEFWEGITKELEPYGINYSFQTIRRYWTNYIYKTKSKQYKQKFSGDKDVEYSPAELLILRYEIFDDRPL